MSNSSEGASNGAHRAPGGALPLAPALSDVLATPPSAFITKRERDAYFVIRGFVFQVEKTIRSWLRLRPREVLVLENGEDIDHLARVLVDGTWREERELGQIKNREDNITLRGGCEPLANFAEHRKANEANPDLFLRFRFTTNAQVTAERPYVMAGALPKDEPQDKRPGIELWRAVAQKSGSEAERATILAALKTFLLRCEKPDKLPEETWANFRIFAENGSDAQWQEFIERFEWETGHTPPLALSAEIQSEMLSTGAAATPEQARVVYNRLFAHVFFTLSRPGSKQLEAQTWRDVAAQEPDPNVRTTLERLNADVVELATRLAAVEMRTDKLEVITGGISEQVLAQGQHIVQSEAAQSAGFSLMFEKQDAAKEALDLMRAQLAEMTRTRTAEELKNSPEAQEWRLELRLEDTRQLLSDGKVRTAKAWLEQMREDAEALANPAAKSRLLSRVLGQIAFCEWRSGNLPDAARHYHQAHELAPEDPKATANAAFATLFIEEPADLEKALSLGRSALERDPASDDALAVTSHALSRLNRHEEIAPLLQDHPDAAKGLQTVFTLSAIALESGDYASAQDHARRSCDLAPGNATAQRMRCDAYFVPIQQQWRFDPPILLRFPAEQQDHLHIAEDAATRAVEAMKDWEERALAVEVLQLRATIRDFLGRVDQALADCDAALAISPSEPTVLLTKGEILLRRKNDAKAAVPLLLRVAQDSEAESYLTIYAAVLCAEAHVALHEWAEAIAVLQHLYHPDPAQPEQMDLARLLGQAAHFSGNTMLLETIKRDLETHYPDDQVALTTLADFARYEDDLPRHVSLLKRACERAEGSRLDRAKYLLAQGHALNREWEPAIALLQPLIDLEHVDRQEPDPILRLYLQVLSLAGRKQEASDLACQVRGDGRAIKSVSEYEANFAADSGDLPHARHLLEELSADNPDDVPYARNVAALALHAGVPAAPGAPPAPLSTEDIEAARTALGRVSLDRVKGDAAQIMDFARLRQRAGLADALDWAYSAIRAAPNDAQIGGLYTQYIFMEVGGDDPRLDHQQVQAESAIELKRRGQSETWIVTAEPSGDPHELPLDHPFVPKLLGKRAGDQFEAQEQPVNRDGYEVVSVKSKYVWAAQDLTRKIESGIVQPKWMAVGHFSLPNTVEGAREERQKLRELLDSGVTATRLYTQRGLSFSAIAQLSTRTVFDLWRADSANGGYRVAERGHFYAADGTDDEMQKHRALASSATAVVLDATALITIVHLGLEEVVSRCFERLVVARELEAEVQGFFERQGQEEEDFGDGSDSTQRHRDFARRLRDFVRSRCQIVAPLPEAADAERAIAHGRAAIATIRAAKVEGLPLWADDLRLRFMARDLDSVPGLGVQAVLERAVARGALSDDQANDAIRRLLLANYGILQHSKGFLWWVLERNNMSATAEVRRILRVLAYWEISHEVAVPLIGDLLAQVCQAPLLFHRRQELGAALLDALAEGRATRSLMALLKYLESSLSMNLLLHNSTLEVVNAWAKTKIQLLS